ncbi:acrB/AcrD/AcrF family protein, partial [Vibrio parahaemolyticus V-223/04]
AYGSYLQHA